MSEEPNNTTVHVPSLDTVAIDQDPTQVQPGDPTEVQALDPTEVQTPDPTQVQPLTASEAATRAVTRDADGPRLDDTLKLDHAIAHGNLSLPSRFGRYQVLKRIGIGGFASVYAAYDPELESEVAVKVLAENHSANTLVRQRFVAEARVARRLGNERLIGVFDLGETDDGRPFVVMELAPRGTLRQRIVRTGRPSRDDLVRLIDQLGACMAAIHAKGVVHRDIKPSNLLFRTADTSSFIPGRLIEDDEILVLADFGLARDISGGASALTVGGGTEGYMAPEQAITDGKPDFRADLYSATVVVAEMTTGRNPQRLDLTTADISTDMLAALTRSLSVARDKRPPTAEAWRDELVAAYTDDPAATARAAAAAGPAEAKTAPLERTRIGSPQDALTETQTDGADADSPNADVGPESFVAPDRQPDVADNGAIAGSTDSEANRTHAPPPGLPADPAARPSPPAGTDEPERDWSAAIAAAAKAQAEAEEREAKRKAAAKEAKRAAREARRRERQQPKAPGSPPGATPPIAPPAPPATATGAREVPARPRQPVRQPGHPPTSGSAPAPTDPARVNPPPTSRPAARTPPVGVPPASLGPNTGQPGPVARRPPNAPGPGRIAPGPRPASGAAPVGAIPVPVVPARGSPGPAQVPAVPGDGGRSRSREHMRTANKLNKLERKRNRKLARKARRRRRRLKTANFFLALIRGALAAFLLLVSTTLVLTALIGGPIEGRPGAEAVVLGATIVGFFWGLSYFPFPRSFDV